MVLCRAAEWVSKREWESKLELESIETGRFDNTEEYIEGIDSEVGKKIPLLYL